MARRPSPIVQRLALEGGDEVIAELKRLGLAGEVAGRELKKQFDALNKTGLDPFTASLKRAQVQMRDLSKSFASVGREFTNVGRTMSLAVTAPIVAGFGFAIKAATDFESKMADIARVTEIPTPDGLQQLGEALRRMAVDLGVSIGDLQDIAQAAGQAGIPFADLASFTELVAKGAVALNLSFDETGQSLAKIKTALDLTIPEVGLLIDAVAKLADEGAAADSEIIGVVQTVGSIAKAAGISALDVAALGSSMISMGVDAESAGTAIRNMVLNLSSGASATDPFREALAQLGLDAEDVAKRLQTDGVGVILDLFERLRQQAPEVRLALLQGLFDRRAAQSLAPLIGNLGELERQLETVSDEANFAGRANEEFARRAETSAQKMREFKAALEELGITVGNELLPTFTSLTETVTELTSAFADSGPLVRWGVGLAAAAAAAGPLIFAIGQTLNAIGKLLKAGAFVIGLFIRWRGVLALVATGFGLLSAPLAATVAGIAALTAGLVFLATRQSAAAQAGNAHSQAMAELEGAIQAVEAGIPGAITEVERLGKAHIEAGLKAIQHAKDEVRALKEIRDARIADVTGLGSLGDAANPNPEEFGDFTSDIDRKINESLNNLSKRENELKQLVAAVGSVGTELLATADDAEVLGKAVEEAGGKIIRVTGGGQTRSFNVDQFGEVTRAIKETGDEAEKTGDKIKGAAERAGAKIVTIPEEWRKAGTAAQEAGATTKAAIDDAAAGAGALAENVRQVPVALSEAGTAATTALEPVQTAFVGIEAQATQTATALPGLFTEAASAIAAAFTSAFGRIQSELAALVSAVTAAMARIGESLAAVRREIAATRAAASAASSGGGGGGFASGGQVFGPGTSTSDSIPAWLSNREFVQPTASVDYYGVDFMEMVRRRLLPQNVMALIRQAMGGVRGFRDGGMVLPHFTAPRFEIPRFNTGGLVPAMAGVGSSRNMGVLTLRAAPNDGFQIQGPVDVLDTFSRAMSRAGLTKAGRGPARLRG